MDQTVAEPERTDLTAPPSLDRSIAAYIERCRKRIPEFVESTFTLKQSWKLQRATLWFDLACAPVNSAWALPYLTIQKVAESLDRVGYPAINRWAKRLPSGIVTGYQRKVERRIRQELLEWDGDRSPTSLPDGFLKALEETPALRRVTDTVEFQQSARTCAHTLVGQLRQLSSARAIVGDVAGTLLTLALSWWLLGNTSMSLRDIAHVAAKENARERAASKFFLGKKMGSGFYKAFPPKVDETEIWTFVVGLGLVLTICAMACTILSDPIRKLLGLHRNRLESLLDQVERELIVFAHKHARTTLSV